MKKLILKLTAAMSVAFTTVLPALAEVSHDAATHKSATSGFLSMLPMLIIFVALFYFLLVRPQQKRGREQKQLLGALGVGDEVVTTAGIVGKITKMNDNYVTIEISKGVEITLQKQAIGATLPKGTIDSI